MATETLTTERVYLTQDLIPFYKKFDYVRDVVDSPEWEKEFKYFYTFSELEKDIPIHETKDDQEKFPLHKQYEEIKKCTKSFAYFCHRYVKILNMTYGTIPFLLYNYQHSTVKHFRERRFNILSKFRQGGLTTVGVLYALWLCVTRNDQQILVMSRTDRESTKTGEMVDRALENMPSWLWDEPNAVITKHEKAFPTDSKISFYTPKAARGRTASVILIDEAAFIPNMHTEYKAMYPVISSGGSVHVISTVNGLGNWYEETYHGAGKKNHFNVIDIDYWEHPGYANPAWAEETKANLGEQAWQQEVERKFLGSGATYISGHIIEELTHSTRLTPPIKEYLPDWKNGTNEKKEFNWGYGALWVWENSRIGNNYMIGVDCAEGVEYDSSCIQIIDADRMIQVAEFYSNKIQLHEFSPLLFSLGKKYNMAKIVIETTGIGGAVLNALQHTYYYENLYYEEQNVRKNRPGIKIGSGNREVVLESMKNKLSLRELKVNSTRLVNELNTFKYNIKRGTAEADAGKHDDAIMALCLVLYAREQDVRSYNLVSEIETNLRNQMTNAKLREIQKEISDENADEYKDIDFTSSKHLDLYEVNKEDIKPFRIRPNDGLLREFGM